MGTLSRKSSAFQTIIELCLELYGEDETRAIMRDVTERVDASGLDGAFASDWIIMTKQAALRRNPSTAHIWASLDIVSRLEKKSDAIPTN
jgi:hypothetical protein